MKTKKLNLYERIKIANWNINCAEIELENDLQKYDKSSSIVEWEIQHIKEWTRYLKNTCKFHNLEYLLVRTRW